MRGSPLRLVRPGEDGKLRLGGGGGGDLEGFSVRYRGTVSSSRKGNDINILRKEHCFDICHFQCGVCTNIWAWRVVKLFKIKIKINSGYLKPSLSLENLTIRRDMDFS